MNCEFDNGVTAVASTSINPRPYEYQVKWQILLGVLLVAVSCNVSFVRVTHL
jgi:hypothetical protein